MLWRNVHNPDRKSSFKLLTNVRIWIKKINGLPESTVHPCKSIWPCENDHNIYTKRWNRANWIPISVYRTQNEGGLAYFGKSWSKAYKGVDPLKWIDAETLKPLEAYQASMPHMKAMNVPFYLVYGSLVSPWICRVTDYNVVVFWQTPSHFWITFKDNLSVGPESIVLYQQAALDILFQMTYDK